MRVLLITHRYPPFGFGGVERLAEQTATALIADGHDVTVLTRRESAAPPLPALQQTDRRGVKVLMMAGGGRLQGRFPGPGPRLEALFERTLLDVSPDVILISHLMGHSPLYVSIAQHWGIPVVLELHDFYTACERAHLERPSGKLCAGPEGGQACTEHCFADDDRSRERWALRSHLFRLALEQADQTVSPSNFVADYFQRTFELPVRPTVIGNGVDLGVLGPPRPDTTSDQLRLAYVGMVAHHKGPHVIVQALRLARLPSVRLTLFGGLTQPYFQELRTSADEVDNLELLAFGAFEPIQLPMLLADVDAVVIPSLVWETFSIVAREMMSLGIPVVASRIGALSEAVRDGDNGLLFTPGSAHELAAILHTLSEDRSRVPAMRRKIRPDDWITVRQRTSRLEDVLRSTVSRGPRRLDPYARAELERLRNGLLPEPTAA